jgi:hypothetical protein
MSSPCALSLRCCRPLSTVIRDRRQVTNQDLSRTVWKGRPGSQTEETLFGVVFDVMLIHSCTWSSRAPGPRMRGKGRGRGTKAGGSAKPKGAPSARGWQRPSGQRTRRWSKASRPRLQPNRRDGRPSEGRLRRKGEEARFAVNAEIGDGRSGDAGPRAPGFVLERVAVGGGKASKGGKCTAGNPVSRQEETR